MSIATMSSPAVSPQMTLFEQAQKRSKGIGSFDTLDASEGELLRKACVGSRVHLSRWGGNKALSSDDLDKVNEAAGVQHRRLRSSKKLYESKHEAIRKVNALYSSIEQYWKSQTLPYVEPGLRLLRKEMIQEFDNRLTQMASELKPTVEKIAAAMPEIKALAREHLGEFYDERDFPEDVTKLYGISWDYPNVEPPSYLESMCPEVYNQELKRVNQRFNETVDLAIGNFLAEFKASIDNIAERLTGTDPNGKQKIFRNTMVEGLVSRVEEFRQVLKPLCGSRVKELEIENLVTKAQNLFKGFPSTDDASKELRNSTTFRDTVRATMVSMQQSLESLIVEAPRRKITRRGLSVAG